MAEEQLFVFIVGMDGKISLLVSHVLAAFVFDAVAFPVIGVTRVYSREESAKHSDDKIFWFVDATASSL